MNEDDVLASLKRLFLLLKENEHNLPDDIKKEIRVLKTILAG